MTHFVSFSNDNLNGEWNTCVNFIKIESLNMRICRLDI